MFKLLMNTTKPVFAPEDETGAGAAQAPAAGTPAAAPPAGEASPDSAAPAEGAPSSPASGEQTSLLGDGEPAKSEGEGGKAGEGPGEPSPVTIDDLSLPEGWEFPEEAQADFLEAVNDQSLSRGELVQKLIDMQAASTQNLLDTQVNQWNTMQTEWREAASALPDIGGDKLNETLANIRKGLDAAGATPELYQALTLTGAGNNPHVIKVLHALTKPFLEGSPVSGAPATEPVSRAERMFPSMSKG